jgi:hypothetical protein
LLPRHRYPDVRQGAGIPHFHVRYGGQIAVFAIGPFELLRRLVRDWAQLHEAELMRTGSTLATADGLSRSNRCVAQRRHFRGVSPSSRLRAQDQREEQTSRGAARIEPRLGPLRGNPALVAASQCAGLESDPTDPGGVSKVGDTGLESGADRSIRASTGIRVYEFRWVRSVALTLSAN